MKKLIIILLALMPIFATAQSTYDHQGKIRMRYNNGGSPDTLLIQFSGDSVLYDANNPFHKFAGGVIMDSIKLNGVWETSFAGSQWTTSGSNIYYNTGNVGINNASPSYKLDVNGLIGGSNIETNTTSLSTKLGYEAGTNENEAAERSNVSIGFKANYTSTTGYRNVIIGKEAGYSNTGYNNTFVGYISGNKNTSGWANTFIGIQSGVTNSTGNNNTYIGSQSGYLSTGSDNVYLGFRAGYRETGSNKLFIDNQDRTSEANARVSSLIYGKFDPDTLNQFVDINGRLRHTATTAEIYRHVDSTARTQSIPNGTTPTKIVVFSDNGVSSHCTADAANDKITITKPGIYDVKLSISYASGTINVNWFGLLFLNGSVLPNIHSQGNTSASNQYRSTTLSGKIKITSVPVDLDYRVKHDYGSAVNLTFISANLNVNYIGE